MATAPAPGSFPDADEHDDEVEDRPPRGFRIEVRDEAGEIYLADIGPRDDAMVRRETNKPHALGYKVSLIGAVQQLADGESIGMDTLCVLWWFARRKAGDTTESLAAALDRFPSLGELDKVVDIERIDDEEADAEDPLPSAGG